MTSQFSEFLQEMQGKDVAVRVSTHHDTIFTTLKEITYENIGAEEDQLIVDGIILEKWGWFSKKNLLAINKVKRKK
ncbi:MAG: hypothetical protein ACOCRX_11755 [Candidatus Woesearchaeota archaeon]